MTLDDTVILALLTRLEHGQNGLYDTTIEHGHRHSDAEERLAALEEELRIWRLCSIVAIVGGVVYLALKKV
jgi:hypothetical protein